MNKHDRLQQIDALFAETLRLAPSDRHDYLASSCGDDAELYREVAALLTDSDSAAEIIGESVADFAGTLLQDFKRKLDSVYDAADLEPGQAVGRYRIVRTIGRGGMGTVYLAERADGSFEKRVAIKVVRGGVGMRGVVQRFQQERRVLARLEHPNIARLLDGGTADDGLLYFVMEYGEGRRITDYCDEERCTVSERLELFRQVAQAVRHAHNRLIVHRDLKPANVLVSTGDDGAPRVMLLDFGIARLIEGDDTDGLIRDASVSGHERNPAKPDDSLTQITGVRPLTPEFAAPEQLAGETITAATDVYALGLLLYVLLAGTDSAKRGRQGVPLSVAVTAEAARLRRTTESQLRRRFAGDLEAIVLRATADEPTARYASVDGLLDDLARYADGFPVRANHGGVAYRVRKYVARNRVFAGGTVAVFLMLLVLVGVLSVQQNAADKARQRAERERDKAAAVAVFLEEMLAASDPFDAQRRDTMRVAALLKEGATQLQNQLTEQPLVRAQMLGVVGRTLSQLRHFGDAEPLLREALALREQYAGPLSIEAGESLFDLASMLYHASDKSRGDSLARRALEIRLDVFGEQDVGVAEVKALLGLMQEDFGNADEAEALILDAIDTYRATVGRSDARLARGYSQLASALLLKGDIPGTASAYDSALALHRAYRGSRHPLVGATLSNYAFLKIFERDFETAAEMQREAISLMEPVLGERHPRMVSVYNQYGLILRRQGRLGDAEQLLTDVLHAQREGGGTFSGAYTRMTATMTSLASVYVDQERHDEAVALQREAFQLAREHLDIAPQVVYAGHLSRVLTAAGSFEQAEATLKSMMDVPGVSEVQRSLLGRGLVRVYAAWGKEEEAERWRATASGGRH